MMHTEQRFALSNFTQQEEAVSGTAQENAALSPPLSNLSLGNVVQKLLIIAESLSSRLQLPQCSAA